MKPEQALTPLQLRVLGVLVEKAMTTPDQYPLSLNALTAGCNQKSNRDPVMALEEEQVLEAVDQLRQAGLAYAVHTSGGRVQRYQHNAREGLELGPEALPLMTELWLRGTQTAGELRSRVQRMKRFDSLQQLQACLDQLVQEQWVERHPPAAGSRAPRYRHGWDQRPLPEPASKPAPTAPAKSATGQDWENRLAALEARVASLEAALGRNPQPDSESAEDA
ncbi:MAG: DUF480 domain-containing protein [Planctomycetota bacterium]|nr:MAG: DUF480 domain-containing protein [Planctomycetota bacterium]